jgi:uncharacterized OB-fold protein
VRGIVAAAAYLPGRSPDRVGVRAPDEDGFTMAVEALERLLEGVPPPARELPLQVVGDLDPVPPEGFSPLLGSPVGLLRAPGGGAGLREAVIAAAARDGPEVILAVSSRPAGPVTAAHAPRDAAAAILLGDRADGSVFSPETGRPPGATALEEAVGWYRAVPEALHPSWLGDWDAALRAGAGWAAGSSDPSPPARVAEGAYWPRPTYQEGLPSRWRLTAERCTHCQRTSFPSRGQCRGCGRRDALTPVRLDRRGGRVIALTWIGPGGQPTEFDPQVEGTGGYGVAIVEVAPGTFGTFQLADVVRGEVSLGDPVRTSLRRLYAQEGAWRYGRKASPLRPGDGRRS